MTLELAQLVTEIDSMGQALAQRAAVLSRLAVEAGAGLRTAAMASDELRARVQAMGERWTGAVPTDEAVDAAFDLPAHPATARLLGADGSQVYPDRHATALYYVINVGSIAYDHGGEAPPAVASHSQVFYREDDLYPDSHGLIASAWVDAQRDVAELAELARLAEAGAGPCLALVDNGLTLWLAQQAREGSLRLERLLGAHISSLTSIRSAQACLAGFIGRPRHAQVVQLAEFASRPPDTPVPDSSRPDRFRGLTDLALFEGRLGPGQRSALFAVPMQAGLPARYAEKGHAMTFFYLNCGDKDRSEVARVEVPQWVALDRARLDFVHAALVEQCRTPQGFPYVLVRAHELAVVTGEERQVLDDMVVVALMRQGLSPRVSQKAQTKQWTGGRRQHTL